MKQRFLTSVLQSKRKVLYVLLPAALLVGVGSIATAQAAPPRSATFMAVTKAAPTATATPATETEAPDAAEPAGGVESTATDPAEPAGAADTGHQDTGAQADHQFDGQE
jgi:hypothetical protein